MIKSKVSSKKISFFKNHKHCPQIFIPFSNCDVDVFFTFEETLSTACHCLNALNFFPVEIPIEMKKKKKKAKWRKYFQFLFSTVTFCVQKIIAHECLYNMGVGTLGHCDFVTLGVGTFS